MLIPFETLFPKYNIQTKGILHFGANEGQEYPRYKKLGVENIAFVEAIPEVFEKLNVNCPDAINIQACLSDVDNQKVKFNIASNDGQSSSFLNFKHHAERHPTVKFVDSIELITSRFDTLVKVMKFPIDDFDFIVADLQGAELMALKGMGDLLHKFKYAYIEINQDELYEGNPLVEDIDVYLDKFGFIGVETKMTGFMWGDKAYIKRELIAKN